MTMSNGAFGKRWSTSRTPFQSPTGKSRSVITTEVAPSLSTADAELTEGARRRVQLLC